MGRRSDMEDEVAFVEASEQHRVEEEGPDAVRRLIEPDVVMRERVGDIQEFGAKAKGSARGDVLHEEVPRILERGEAGWERTRGGPVARGRRLAVEERVGALVVVLVPECIEGALLGRERGAEGPNGPALERAMHAFKGAVLLRTAGMNPPVLNAQAHPPGVEIREAVNRLRGERHAVVRADAGVGGA